MCNPIKHRQLLDNQDNYKLFNAMTNAITILQEAQNDTEEVYVNSNPVALELLKIEPTPKAEKDSEIEKL